MNELAVRTGPALVLIAAALLAAVQGGTVLAVLVAAVATLMFYEWTRIVRWAGAPRWYIGGFFYALLPALALLWIRGATSHGLDAAVLGVHRHLGDRHRRLFRRPRDRRAEARADDQPEQDLGGPVRRHDRRALLGGALGARHGRSARPLALDRRAHGRSSAQAGDLTKAGMKRRAGVKDSAAPGCPATAACSTGSTACVPVAVLTARLRSYWRLT